MTVGLPVLLSGLGFVQAWRARHFVYADGFAYLEVAGAYLDRDWTTAINGYWSPLYSWLLAAGRWLFRVPLERELLLGHALNLGAFGLALLSLEYLLRSMRLGPDDPSEPPESVSADHSRVAVRVFAYGLFAWVALDLIRLQKMTPDLLVLALALVAGGVALRLAREPSALRGALLGAVLGLGYLAKAFFVPVAPFFVVPALLPHRRRPWRMVGVASAAVAGWLVVAGPWVGVLSAGRGGLTLGDAGKLNYAWYVNGVRRHLHWQGEGDTGVPAHPTRRILDEPDVYEFGEPLEVTYPPWYDASYWHQGLENSFDPRRQARVLIAAVAGYGQSFDWFLIFLLAVVLHDPRGLLRLVRRGLPLVLPGAAGLLGYAFVHVDDRLIGPWALLLSLGLVYAFPMRELRDRGRLASALLIAMGTVGFLKGGEATVEVWQSSPSRPHAVMTAEALAEVGMEPGTQVAMIGSGFSAQWARIARLRIVAELPTETVRAYWEMTPEKHEAALDAFRSAGAAWVVSPTMPPETLRSDWTYAEGLWVRGLGRAVSGHLPRSRGFSNSISPRPTRSMQ